MRSACLTFLLLAPWVASGDRGALSLEAGLGANSILVGSHHGTPNHSLMAGTPSVRFGLRYALTHQLELSLGGHWDPPMGIEIPGVTIDTNAAGYPGTQRERGAFTGPVQYGLTRYGLTAGARWVWGLEWKLVAGFEAGWSRREYSDFRYLDAISRTVNGADLPGYAPDAVILSPLGGFQWESEDRWSISVLPRFEVLIGPAPSFALILPVLFSYDWYL